MAGRRRVGNSMFAVSWSYLIFAYSSISIFGNYALDKRGRNNILFLAIESKKVISDKLFCMKYLTDKRGKILC